MEKGNYSSKLCRHFGLCGGCRLQDVPYPNQLRRKEELCQRLAEEAGIDLPQQPIVPSPRIYYYRNKMEFTFQERAGELRLGLHCRERKREVFDLQECLISSPAVPAIVSIAHRFARESGLPAYDVFRHTGFWRNLVIREGKFTGELMVNLVTTSRGSPDLEPLADLLFSLKIQEKVVSLIQTENDSLSNAVVPQRIRIIRGRDYLEETLDGLTFQISPFSFFQVNPFIIRLFYRKLLKYLDPGGGETVCDLYCGMGPVSLVLAGRVGSVLGIEKEEESIAAARRHADLNRISNVTFLAGEARKVLWERKEKLRDRIDIMVINPPRAGLSKKVRKRVKEIRPRTIAYSSCNPATFFANLPDFLEDYAVEVIQPFDFFPHTPHLEILGILRLK